MDSGALDGRPLDVALAISPFIAVGAVLCLVVSRSLNITSFGDELAKNLGGNVIRTQVLGYAVVVAPALLLAADIVGRVVIPPAELPAGIVTAFIGAPVLIWLIRKRGADRT